jgi:hypothetical protein
LNTRTDLFLQGRQRPPHLHLRTADLGKPPGQLCRFAILLRVVQIRIGDERERAYGGPIPPTVGAPLRLPVQAPEAGASPSPSAARPPAGSCSSGCTILSKEPPTMLLG